MIRLPIEDKKQWARKKMNIGKSGESWSFHPNELIRSLMVRSNFYLESIKM
jgi:hypothetical protein